jgi:hypothetical protein
MKDNENSRREFLKKAMLASATAAISPTLFAKNTNASLAKNRVKLALIGIGNRGGQISKDLFATGLCEIVALCDVDMGAKHTQEIMAMFPKAKQFKDFREMFNKFGKEFEAVSVGVPDHSHFPICMTALAMGKHIYVEKPMACTFHEVELMMQAARKHPNVVLRWVIKDTLKPIIFSLRLGKRQEL